MTTCHYYLSKGIAGIFTLLICSSIYAQDSLLSHIRIRDQGASRVYNIVEQMPQYPKGQAGIFTFIQDHLRYPQQSVDSNIEGRVVVNFIVNEDGSVSDIQLHDGVNTALDAEAIRVVSMLPRFTPGRRDGVPVKVSFTLPIYFKIRNNSPVRACPAQCDVYNLTEEMPYYPHHTGTMYDTLRQISHIPLRSLDNTIAGHQVILSYIVSETGAITDMEVLKSAGPSYDMEAMRLLNSLGNFTPGRMSGHTVRVKLAQTFVFE